MKLESTSKAAFFETNSLTLLSFIFFLYVFLNHKRDRRLTYLLFVVIFLQIHLNSPSRQKTYMKVKAFNKILFFTVEFIHTCNDLMSYHLSFVQSQSSNE